ncbi:transposase [Actinokineospora baliensis]|uniref:transposase n=1 Tax=Actinokineospora baliensis TaxID=547056 RepID=UPI0035576ADD
MHVAHRSPYSPEFREEAVQMALRSKRPIAETARELNMNSETLRVWVRSYEREQGADSAVAVSEPLATDERARLRELERRNRELEMEVSFLKKAAAYFAKDAE